MKLQPVPTAPVPAPRHKYDLATAAGDYPGWEGPPKRTLLLCTQPRSGSTLLGETLHAAGGWGCPLEYFHHGFQPGFERLWGTADFPAYVRAVHQHRTDPSGTFGVKIFWGDIEELCARLEPEAHGPLLDSLDGPAAAKGYRSIHALLTPLFPNPTFVYLARQDAVRQAVSGMIASQTGVWRAIPMVQEKVPLQEPAYDYERIAGNVAFEHRCRRRWEAYFQANLLAPVRINYESLSDHFQTSIQALFTALGRPDAAIPPVRMRRQADAHSEAIVLRFLREMKSRSQSPSAPA